MSTVLLYSFAEVIEDVIEQKKKESCAGCEIEHPSQRRHDCLMMSDLEHLQRHFEAAFQSFRLLDVLNKYSLKVKKLNLSTNLVSYYFFLNVVLLDKLHSNVSKNNVYQFLERKVKRQECL